MSSRALYRAITLNGVAAEENLQAFELGRVAAHEGGQFAAPTTTPETMPLEDLIAHRAGELTAYQNRAYADRYLATIGRIQATPGASEALARAAAVNLYKLMAYKDEYEVARLYTDGRFASALAGTFSGGKVKVWLAPPLIAAKGPDGRPRKMAFGGWMLKAAFPILARLKGLRGGPFDFFGATAERRLERRLIADYEADLARIAAELTPARLRLAERIAAAPDAIRGFGYIKEAAAALAAKARDGLWKEWEAVA
ncbi:MAG: hypothetical protein JOZ27_00690 [Caulobacteraceae bacterium]|nr:hypothetical protein [Caulobacteraceae bacterium]